MPHPRRVTAHPRATSRAASGPRRLCAHRRPRPMEFADSHDNKLNAHEPIHAWPALDGRRWWRCARCWQGARAEMRCVASCLGMTCCGFAQRVRRHMLDPAGGERPRRRRIECMRCSRPRALRAVRWPMLSIHCSAHSRGSGVRGAGSDRDACAQARARCWSSFTRRRSTQRSLKPLSRPGSSSRPLSLDSPRQVRSARARARRHAVSGASDPTHRDAR